LPLYNFLRAGERKPLRHADIVVQITDERVRDRLVPRPAGHSGIIVSDKASHKRGEAVRIIHMIDYIVEDEWSSPPSEQSWIDVVASASTIEDAIRDQIIIAAVTSPSPTPSKLNERPHSCYWLGRPNALEHPRHPDQAAYAFSCSTFVYHCYEQAGVAIVNAARAPLLSDVDRRTLIEWNPALVDLIDPEPFPRLACGHIICAMEKTPERFPFDPSDEEWPMCSDAVVFGRLIADAAQDAATRVE
jgi:hypothetical protein